MQTELSRGREIPAWLKWAALVWFAAWFPTYWRTWGAINFLRLCDVTVLLTCIGLWTSSSLLLSSQAVATILVDCAWMLDAAWQVLFSKHLTGGTEYMWDAHYPLWVRLLSLFHIVWPILLLWAIARVGYDRRGWILQIAIAAVVIPASRLAGPELNYNYSFRDPFFHGAWGPAAAHLTVVVAFMAVVDYWPTHLVLKRFFAAPEASLVGQG